MLKEIHRFKSAEYQAIYLLQRHNWLDAYTSDGFLAVEHEGCVFFPLW